MSRSTSKTWMLGVAVSGFVVSGCTADPAPNVNDGPLVMVASATSEKGTYDVDMLAHVSTITRGDYDLEFQITSNGSGIEGLQLQIVPWMPAMGHGTPIVPAITELGSGAYAVDNADLFMAGLWQLRTTFTAPDDYATPAVTVE